MKLTICLVIDDPSQRQLDWFDQVWKPKELAHDLTKAGATATTWTGTLEEAQDASAYVLYTDKTNLAERAKVDAFKVRLAKTLGTEMAPQGACVLAETYGLLGTIDAIGPAWFGAKRKDPDAANFLNVKRTIAKQLNWPLDEINSTAGYARTNPIAKPLPRMILSYLELALTSS